MSIALSRNITCIYYISMTERPLTCVVCSSALPDISSAKEVALSIFQPKQLATLQCLQVDSVTISQASNALQNDYNLRIQGLYCSDCSETNESIFRLLNDLKELQRKLQNFRRSVADHFIANYPDLGAVAVNKSQNCRGAAKSLKEIRLKIASEVFRQEPKVTSLNVVDTNFEGACDPLVPDVINCEDDYGSDTEPPSQIQPSRHPVQSEQDRSLLLKFGLLSCSVQLQPLPSDLQNALGVADGPHYCLFEDCQPRTAFTLQQRNEHLSRSHGLSEQDVVALNMTVNIASKSSRFKSISSTPTKNSKTTLAENLPGAHHLAQQQPVPIPSTCIFHDCHFTETLKSTDDFLLHIQNCHGIELTPAELNSLTTRTSDPKRKTYSCSMCAAEFRFQVALQKHFREHHASTQQDVVGQSRRPKSIAFVCPVVACLVKEKFATTADRDLHVASVHPNLKQLQQCLVCKKYLADSEALKNHLSLIHLCESVVVCEICGKQYATASGLAAHMANHDASLMLPCPHCDAKFVSTSGLRYHIKRVHIQKPEYHCEHCGKGFYTNYKLNDHIKCVHINSKNVICEYCAMAFPVRSYLRAHLVKTHGAPKGRNSREKHKHRPWQGVYVKSEKPKRRSKKMLVNFEEESSPQLMAAPLNSSLSDSPKLEVGTSNLPSEIHGTAVSSSSAGYCNYTSLQSGKEAGVLQAGVPTFIYDTHNAQ